MEFTACRYINKSASARRRPVLEWIVFICSNVVVDLWDVFPGSWVGAPAVKLLLLGGSWDGCQSQRRGGGYSCAMMVACGGWSWSHHRLVSWGYEKWNGVHRCALNDRLIWPHLFSQENSCEGLGCCQAGRSRKAWRRVVGRSAEAGGHWRTGKCWIRGQHRMPGFCTREESRRVVNKVTLCSGLWKGKQNFREKGEGQKGRRGCSTG